MIRPSIVANPITRRRRFQRGSLQKRKSGGAVQWIVFWWDNLHRRRSQILGPCATMSRPQALAEMAQLLLPVNASAGEPTPCRWTVGGWIRDVFLPFSRRKWKLSTASTTGDRIRKHVIADLGSLELSSVTRDLLQGYLEQKAAVGLSFSVVDHLRWDLRAIFRLAVQDRLIPSNPADMLFTPRTVPKPTRRVLDAADIPAMLAVLELEERLIVQLALFSGMRPGEILALHWKHVAEDHVTVAQRLYRGHLDQPKTERSKRQVALSPATMGLLHEWRRRQPTTNPDQWVFPSSIGTTALGRDNTWRWRILPKWKPIGLGWATFQVLRRTHASFARQANIDPKLVADQLGHALGVNLNVYTIAALDQRREAVQTLEATLLGSTISRPRPHPASGRKRKPA